MRRGSIVGPLLLITVGGLFLANNLRPELSLFQLIAEYWPFLFIGWGLLRLIEIFFWYARSKPLPARGISSGEWTSIIFLALIGSGMFAFHRHVGFNPVRWRIQGLEMFGESYDYTIAEQRIAAGKSPRVVVENQRGNARIVGVDGEEVKVSGRKTVRALEADHAAQADKSTGLELVKQGEVIYIRTNLDRVEAKHRVMADLEISVPKGATVEARGRYGDFDITDLDGSVEIESDNAGVRIQNVSGNVKTNLRRSDVMRAVNVKGNVEVKGRSDNIELENVQGEVMVEGGYFELSFRKMANVVRFDGMSTKFRAERVPGQIRMTPNTLSAENVIGPMTLTTDRAKDIEITDVTESLDIGIDRGDLEVRASKAPLPKMNLRTNNGDIVLAIPEGAKFSLRGETRRGEVENELGNAFNVRSDERTASVTGKVGEAGPEIVLDTDRGSITLRKATGEVLARPPEPEFPESMPRPPKPPRPARPEMDGADKV
jgi:DUF4097 and DUF4098 domain-containing protein YvlB